ncbi:hypothetical protein FRC10_006089 [Ceratobasidium sp. 414]|nr:hypothetical protein FRC10_006089 [Ceratobasidium sp. 414]
MPSDPPTLENLSTSTTVPQTILDKLDPEYREFVLSLPPSSPKPARNPAWSSKFRQAEKDEPPELGEAPGIPVGSTRTIELGSFSANVLTPPGAQPQHGRAPEHPFPAAVDDLWTTLTWIRDEGKNRLNIDADRIAVGGASAGGNLAAVLAQRAASASPPIPIALQVLMVPITDCTFAEDDCSRWTPSMIEYADIYALRAVDMIWFRDLYIPNTAQRSLPDASPLLQENEAVFKNMAPAWVGVAELDVLRSEGELYAAKLRQHGVPVTLTMYKGMLGQSTIDELPILHQPRTE